MNYSADFDDPNLDPSHATEFDDESPYPEVRSAVANTDDPSIHATTLRTWVLGLAWAIIMPGVNQFFFFRYPSVPITGIVAQLLSFPIGRFCAAYLPRKKIFGISLNPGPFTIKEHVLITVGDLFNDVLASFYHHLPIIDHGFSGRDICLCSKSFPKCPSMHSHHQN
jgi:hypothetical protein